MKIAVYAIAKNEEKHVERWATSASGADYRIVLDTGSTDATITRLKTAGVVVRQSEILPWRFDTARNQSLALVPPDADVCIALDLDELLMPGWRTALEKAWTPTTTLLRYPFVSTWKGGGTLPNTVSYGFKIHARHGYRWEYPIHEILRPQGRHEEAVSEELHIHQHQDPTKDRSLYRAMLESLTRTEPNETRYRMYLGRHYFDARRYTEALREIEAFLTLSGSVPNDSQERAFAYRLLAWTHDHLGHPPAQAIQCLLHAVATHPHARETWLHLAEKMAEIGNWPNCFSAVANALRITDRTQSALLDPKAWTTYPLELFLQSGTALGIPASQLTLFKKDILDNPSHGHQNPAPLQRGI